MKYMNFFIQYKKYFFLVLFFLILSLSICTIVMYKKNKKNILNQNIEEFKKIVDNFKKKNLYSFEYKKNFFKKNKNIYGTLIGINLAKQLFIKKKYMESISILKEILLYTQEENLRYLIKLNLVKIYIKQKNFSLALKIINNIHDEYWNNLFQKNKKNIPVYKEKIIL
ncbi:UPF0070 protein YfgM [Buchnera aphidicola (Cinara piceae)]|uniref:Ancillary SecYEG translocon subunit n=1 Tax=Buchnera aphidicola (Cinara piceae) TaxID=1660043 RepID=A0A803FUK7_9GAMM|nr:tetratricopeptide repeat protein [Buchnera aphidicola]VFP88851.1 UPF0070 protein YfgM [Buchnera aphidicola (Cinara piceae)]